MSLKPSRSSRHAVLLVGSLASPAFAGTVMDVSVLGSVSAFASGTIFFDDDRETFRESQNGSEEATDFTEFPLSVDVVALVTPPGSDETFAFGDASATLDASRSADGVRGSANLTGGGGFGTIGDQRRSGSGDSTVSLRYAFDVTSEVGYTLAINLDDDLFAAPFNGATSVELVLRDETAGVELASVTGLDLDSNLTGMKEAVGTLNTGLYSLGLEASASIGEFDFDSGFDFSLVFDGLDAPPVIPSPAALPLGVALLGGLAARRRR